MSRPQFPDLEDDGPSYPFEFPQDPELLPEIPYYTALQEFVDSGLNQPPDQNVTTLADLSPENITRICRTSLGESEETKDLDVFLNSACLTYQPEGCQQILRFTFSKREPGVRSTFAPLTATIFQYETSAQAYNAFTHEVSSFQIDWHSHLNRNSEIGNYSFQTRNSIFWQRWTTVINLTSDYSSNARLSVLGLPPLTDTNFIQFAHNLDRELTSQRGPLRRAPRARIGTVTIPPVQVNSPTRCQIEFLNGAHRHRSVQLLDFGYADFSGQTSPEGRFALLGKRVGRSRLRVRVAHVNSLKVTSALFSVNVLPSADGNVGLVF